tara:strand:- start:1053 stop:1667 length:615 start_codon:yes stop_codon:yes gene_type:complete
MSFLTNITNVVTRQTGVYNSDGFPSNVDNDQGNIRAGGTIAESEKFSSSALGEGGEFTTVVSGVNNQSSQVGPAAFNYKDSRGSIIRYSTTLAGQPNKNALLGGSSDSSNGDSIHQRRRIRSLNYKVSVVNGYWSEFSGSFNPALSTTIAGGWNISEDDEQGGTLVPDGTDTASNPSSAAPGRLTYLGGNPIPTNDLYGPRYNW